MNEDKAEEFNEYIEKTQNKIFEGVNGVGNYVKKLSLYKIILY